MIGDLPTERRWLACVLMDAGTLELAPIPLSDFYGRANAIVCGAMLALRARREPINTSTLRAELVSANTFAQVGEDALLSLTDEIPNVSDAATLSRTIRQLSRLRSLHADAQDITAACLERDLERANAAAARAARLDYLEEDEIIGFGELCARGLEATVFRKDERSEMAFGTPAVDKYYRPAPGHLVIVAGRPNVGKTSLTFAWHYHTAERGFPSIVVSVDDDESDYGVRGLGAAGQVAPSRIWNDRARLSPTELQAVVNTAAEKKRLPLFFAKAKSKSITAVEALITRAVRVHGCKWASVDFLTKVRAPGRDPRERTNEALSRLGVLASTLGIPIVVLAQLHRLGEKQYREPHLDDFKESGSIEEDAQCAVLLWRENDQSHAPVRAKLGKIKRDAAGRRFTLVRHADTGLLVQQDEEHEDSDDRGWRR